MERRGLGQSLFQLSSECKAQAGKGKAGNVGSATVLTSHDSKQSAVVQTRGMLMRAPVQPTATYSERLSLISTSCTPPCLHHCQPPAVAGARALWPPCTPATTGRHSSTRTSTVRASCVRGCRPCSRSQARRAHGVYLIQTCIASQAMLPSIHLLQAGQFQDTHTQASTCLNTLPGPGAGRTPCQLQPVASAYQPQNLSAHRC